MIRSLYTAVSGLITLENKQNTINNNMANANTTGYKAEDLQIKSFKEVMIQNRDKIQRGQNAYQRIGTISLGAKIDTVTTKFTQGDLKQTGTYSDMAIDGRGFFVVQRGNQQLYTRDGSFRVDIQGYLVTTTGDRVLGQDNNGNIAPIQVGNSQFSVDLEGNINVNGNIIGKIATADFEDYTTLNKVGDNYYEGQNPIMNAQVLVKQGYTENSNVNIIDEMVNLVNNKRSFETTQKIVNMIDSTLDKAANKVGQV